MENLNNYLIVLFYYLFYEHYFNPKPNIVLLVDGFFARGFLHNIDRHKFHITQIYKDEFRWCLPYKRTYRSRR